MLDFKSLITAGVHFGHPRTRSCPKMKPYIWGIRNDIHLIDVSKTAVLAEKAAQFLQATAAEGKTILWIGTKKAARDAIYTYAKQLGMPYVNHRWIGGTLTNPDQIKKSITKLLHYEDILAKTDKATTHYTKKEFNTFQKIVERLSKSVGGIRNLKWPIGAIVVIDVRKERSAIKEAAAVRIPVVALVDTDGEPSIEYVIPGNDDAPRSVNVILEHLAAAAARGKEIAEKNQSEAKATKAAVKHDAEPALIDKKLLEEELEETDGTPRPKGPKRRAPVAPAGGRPQHRSKSRTSGSMAKKSE